MNTQTMPNDSNSPALLAVIFSALTIIMYSFCVQVAQYPIVKISIIPLAIVATNSALGWRYGDEYYPSELLIKFLKYVMHRLLDVAMGIVLMLMVIVASEMVEGIRMKKETTRRNQEAAYIAENRLVEAPTGACGQAAITIQSGESHWCFMKMKRSQTRDSAGRAVDGHDCTVDYDTCVSPNQPGPRIGDGGAWCEEGRRRYVAYFDTANGPVECRIDETLCSGQEAHYMGTRFCVDYADCQPAASHADDNSCYRHQRGRR